MSAFHCFECDITWPGLSRYSPRCMICQGTVEKRDATGIRQAEAEQLIQDHTIRQLRRVAFEEYYTEREAARFRAELDSPPLLS